MKKILVCFFIFTTCASYGQMPKFLVGVNAAGVWNSYFFAKSKPPFLLDDRINWSLGIQSKYFLGKKFWLDGQINFATKNFGSGIDYYYLASIDNDPSLLGQTHYTVKQNYLEVPLSVNYIFGSTERLNFFCSLGFTNSFMMSVSKPNNQNEQYKKYLITGKAGGGVLFPFGRNFFGTAECFTNIYLEKANKYFNNPFQLALGFSVLKKIGTKN